MQELIVIAQKNSYNDKKDTLIVYWVIQSKRKELSKDDYSLSWSCSKQLSNLLVNG